MSAPSLFYHFPRAASLSQAIWDLEHKKIEEGHANALQRMALQRKLGPRPHLDL